VTIFKILTQKHFTRGLFYIIICQYISYNPSHMICKLQTSNGKMYMSFTGIDTSIFIGYMEVSLTKDNFFVFHILNDTSMFQSKTVSW